jgi:hypothetical protein
MTMTYPSPKDPAEIITLSHDFAAITNAPSNPVVTVVQAGGQGSDASPDAIKSGPAQVHGSKVLQKVVGGVSDVDYRITWQVDAHDGSRYVEATLLQVRVAR